MSACPTARGRSPSPLIQEYITGVDLQTHEDIVKRDKNKIVHRYRWIHDVPLRDGKDALKVNWFEIEILNTSSEVTYLILLEPPRPACAPQRLRGPMNSARGVVRQLRRLPLISSPRI